MNVQEDHIFAEFAIMVEELYLFHDVETEDGGRVLSRQAVESAAGKHIDFIHRYLHVSGEEGERLEGRHLEVDLSQIPDEGVPTSDLMDYWIIYSMDYPLEQDVDHLTIFQNFDGDEPRIPSELNLQVLHKGIPVDRAYLAHSTAHTVNLDWEMDFDGFDPDDMESMWERIAEQRHEDGLGITSYSKIYNYLYITGTEVRHEMLIPLMTLDAWVPMERENPNRMTVAEQRGARARVKGFLLEHLTIEINGREGVPILDRFEFFGPDYRDFAQRAPEREVSVFNARVGIVLRFPSEDAPWQVRFEWDKFDEYTPYLSARVYAFDEPGEAIEIDRWRLPYYEWTSDHEHRLRQVVDVGAPELPPEIHVSVVAAGAVVLALVFAGFAWCGRSRRRAMVFGFIAAGCLAGGFGLRSHGMVALAHPFQSVEQPTADEAGQMVGRMLDNIYLAYQYQDEEMIYNMLERSVAGPLLEEVYLQVRRNLRMDDQGGAIARVDDIELLSGTLRPATSSSGAYQAFEYETAWAITATVEHWGHIHRNRKQFKAVFTVEGYPHGWRISAYEPVSEELLAMSTSLRD